MNTPRKTFEALRARSRTGMYFANFAWWLYFAPMTTWPREPETQELLRWVKRCAYRTFDIFDLPFVVEGGECAESLPNAIYITNHRSWLDQPAMIAAAPHLLHFLGAAKYFDFPVLGKVLDTFGCFPVEKGRASQLTDALRRCVEDGGSLAIYPEGTRSEHGEFLPFRSGAYVLSAQTGVPIVPLYLYGAHEALPRERPFRQIRQHPIRVRVGEPFDVPRDFLDAPDTTRYQERFMTEWRAHA